MFHLFLCLLVICIFSLKGVYSNPLPILKASCLSFCCWLVRVLCFVRFRVEAKKTHFSYGSSKMKAWFFWALREAASSGSELHLQRKLVQHFYRMGTQSRGQWGRLLHWPITFWFKRSSKVVNTVDWVLSGSPGFRVLESAFAARSPPGLWPRILEWQGNKGACKLHLVN